MPRPTNLNRLAYFAAVIEAGSFTAAARRLGVTKAVVSQQVSRLEEEVGITLIIRTTRQLRPTEAGADFYRRCASVLREAEEALRDLNQATDEPSGTLRITAPIDYGNAVVAPVIARFTRQYRQARVELMLSDVRLDIVADRIDISIRVGWLKDSSSMARRIGTFRQLLVGTPAMAEHLDHPQALERQCWVANTALSDPLQWSFTNATGESCPVFVRATVSTDTTMAVHTCVRAGTGISVLPDFLVHADLAEGRLVHLLPEWSLADGGIYAVFPPSRFRPAKVRAFMAMLAPAG